MPLRDQFTLRVILYEGEGAQPLDAAERFTALTSLLERGYAVTRTSGERSVAPADCSPVLVLGKFAGSVPDFHADATVRTQNIAGLAPAQLGDLVETARDEAGAAKHGEWKPWFPVIDYDRCTNCFPAQWDPKLGIHVT